MTETVPFAKNDQGEWEGELASGQSTWGLKVFLIEEQVEKGGFSHVQILGIQPRGQQAAGHEDAEPAERYGWISEGGLARLVKTARDAITEPEDPSTVVPDHEKALARLAKADWALIGDDGEEISVFKAPDEDSEGWV